MGLWESSSRGMHLSQLLAKQTASIMGPHFEPTLKFHGGSNSGPLVHFQRAQLPGHIQGARHSIRSY